MSTTSELRPDLCFARDHSVLHTIPGTAILDSDRIARWVVWFVLLGLLARTIRYAVCFPLWDDESFLCVNFISRGYAELLKPLDFHQVAPLLFLWTERTAVRVLGFSEPVLRLFPFLCAIASVLLFRRVASRLLSGAELLLAVAIFAVSYPGIRYGAEAKPYGSDLLVSLVILCLTVEWCQSREAKWLWWIVGLTPLAVGLSYPAVFMLGGASLVVGACLIVAGTLRVPFFGSARPIDNHTSISKDQPRNNATPTHRNGYPVPPTTSHERRAWCAWNVALVASFAFWFWASGRAQAGAEGEFMGNFWQTHFPPVRQPWKLPMWLLRTHASDFLAYPVGGPNWASVATFLLVLVGMGRLWRGGHRVLLGLCLAPAGLHFLAAALQKYPYGGHVKFSQYIAPLICCLTALGAVQVLAWLSARRVPARRALACGCALLAAIGFGVVIRDVAMPYKTLSDFRARAFARGFWFSARHAEEVVCLKSDLGLDFVPPLQQNRELSWSAQFLCNHAIEVDRYRLRPADWSRVSRERPLRCVVYHESRFPLDEARLNGWLAEMQRGYDLIGHETLSFPRLRQNERTLMAVEYVDSYRFVPRDPSLKPAPMAPIAHRPTQSAVH